jgi:hypothetical protein
MTTEETTNARGETYLPPVRVNNKEIDATLIFEKRPTGKFQRITFTVKAVDGDFGDEWHDTYNKTYDSEKQWRAAHARYSKKYAAQQREQ